MNSKKLLQIIEGDTDHSPITLRTLLPHKRTGALLGKGGIVHRFMESTYNVRLYFHQDVDQFGRLASIFGQLENVAHTCREALYRMFTARGEGLVYGEKLGISFLIPYGLAMQMDPGDEYGALATISTRTGTRILLKRDLLPNTTEFILQISVQNLEPKNLNAFEDAIRLLGESYLQHRREALSPRNIYYVPLSMEGQKFLYEDDNENDDNSESDEDEDELHEKLEVEGTIGTQDFHFHPDDSEPEEPWHDGFLTSNNLSTVDTPRSRNILD